jgi:hypothetical protein
MISIRINGQTRTVTARFGATPSSITPKEVAALREWSIGPRRRSTPVRPMNELLARVNRQRIITAAVLLVLIAGCSLIKNETPEEAARNRLFLSNRVGAP